jgi:hypothetical protein
MSEGKILPSFPFGIVINVSFGGEIYLKLSEQNLAQVTQAPFLKDKKRIDALLFYKRFQWLYFRV